LDERAYFTTSFNENSCFGMFPPFAPGLPTNSSNLQSTKLFTEKPKPCISRRKTQAHELQMKDGPFIPVLAAHFDSTLSPFAIYQIYLIVCLHNHYFTIYTSLSCMLIEKKTTY
jgi:hypothetical protein